jgi:modification methylase
MSGRKAPQDSRALSPQVLSGTSVWAVAQRALPAQRRGRYVPACGHHPARMAPDLAAHIIHTYTSPGDLVVDPMCGIGTTLVEAVHAGRDGLGIDCEKRWVALAEQNLDLAAAQGAAGVADVVHGDARDLPGALPWPLVATTGTASLVLTSPPYGLAANSHARVRSTRETGRAGMSRRRDAYGEAGDEANLANAGTVQDVMRGFAQILAGAAWLLQPGGRLVVTARPWRENGDLIDLPSMIIEAAEQAGFTHIDRCVALLAGVQEGRLRARPSFLQLMQLRRARTAGSRVHLIVHEDVLVFEVGRGYLSSGKVKVPSPESAGPESPPVDADSRTPAGTHPGQGLGALYRTVAVEADGCADG